MPGAQVQILLMSARGRLAEHCLLSHDTLLLDRMVLFQQGLEMQELRDLVKLKEEQLAAAAQVRPASGWWPADDIILKANYVCANCGFIQTAYKCTGICSCFDMLHHSICLQGCCAALYGIWHVSTST